MNLKRIFTLAALVLIGGNASAQISVNRSVIEFSNDSRVQDIEILNTGDFKVYLDLKVAEIINPETDTPKRMELSDPRSTPVLVSPRQLLVPPGTRKRVRVIMRESTGDTDRIFRLAVKPYTGKARIDAPGAGKTSSAIRVLVGYDLLLIARPSDKNPQVKVKRDDNSIEFHNAGNTNVLLRRIVQCDSGVDLKEATGEQCVEMQPNRLYAGETYKVKLPKSGNSTEFPVQVYQSVGLENSRSSF